MFRGGLCGKFIVESEMVRYVDFFLSVVNFFSKVEVELVMIMLGVLPILQET